VIATKVYGRMRPGRNGAGLSRRAIMSEIEVPISVKTRIFAKSGAFVGYDDSDVFDWLAIVILPGSGFTTRRIFIVPRKIADERSYTVNRTWRRSGRQAGRGFFVGKLIAAPTPGGQALADHPILIRSGIRCGISAVR
jgi:hypothetical protein